MVEARCPRCLELEATYGITPGGRAWCQRCTSLPIGGRDASDDRAAASWLQPFQRVGERLVPAPDRAELLAELEDLADQARAFVGATRAPNTVRAYAADWRDFLSFCEPRSLGAARLARGRGTVDHPPGRFAPRGHRPTPPGGHLADPPGVGRRRR